MTNNDIWAWKFFMDCPKKYHDNTNSETSTKDVEKLIHHFNWVSGPTAEHCGTNHTLATVTNAEEGWDWIIPLLTAKIASNMWESSSRESRWCTSYENENQPEVWFFIVRKNKQTWNKNEDLTVQVLNPGNNHLRFKRLGTGKGPIWHKLKLSIICSFYLQCFPNGINSLFRSLYMFIKNPGKFKL